ncbi:hypothetical protein [Francisella sp. SYW-2]|uniref:hypothetical protein n=1 Tax=Francisella sp. SYW-2 TaxID=2610886 RepID=UPI00123D7260|nr:hypothetical protein [Francisella sp. SYW-2]
MEEIYYDSEDFKEIVERFSEDFKEYLIKYKLKTFIELLKEFEYRNFILAIQNDLQFFIKSRVYIYIEDIIAETEISNLENDEKIGFLYFFSKGELLILNHILNSVYKKFSKNTEQYNGLETKIEKEIKDGLEICGFQEIYDLLSNNTHDLDSIILNLKERKSLLSKNIAETKLTVMKPNKNGANIRTRDIKKLKEFNEKVDESFTIDDEDNTFEEGEKYIYGLYRTIENKIEMRFVKEASRNHTTIMHTGSFDFTTTDTNIPNKPIWSKLWTSFLEKLSIAEAKDIEEFTKYIKEFDKYIIDFNREYIDENNELSNTDAQNFARKADKFNVIELAAGEIIVKENCVYINNSSGHYAPAKDNVQCLEDIIIQLITNKIGREVKVVFTYYEDKA